MRPGALRVDQEAARKLNPIAGFQKRIQRDTAAPDRNRPALRAAWPELHIRPIAAGEHLRYLRRRLEAKLRLEYLRRIASDELNFEGRRWRSHGRGP
jgi:hypothetical protein